MGSRKKQDIAVLPKREEYRQFAVCSLQEGLGEREQVVFLREG